MKQPILEDNSSVKAAVTTTSTTTSTSTSTTSTSNGLAG